MALFGRNGIELQERDLDILCGLFECRVMTLAHVTELYFDGKGEAAKKRVQKLKAAGFLRERKRRIGDPSVLHIGTKAFAALRDSGRLAKFPTVSVSAMEKRGQVSDLTLRHELAVMDVRAAFFRAVRQRPDLSITEFSTWPTLFQFTARHTSPALGRRELVVKPDGFIRIQEKTDEGTFENLFFLELDRSTESQQIIVQKGACYLDYYQSGGMAVRNGRPSDAFKEFPFRVLMVFQNAERQNNALEMFLRISPPILTQVWTSAASEVSDCPFANVWMRPKDYLSATTASPFDPTHAQGRTSPIRGVRDTFIENSNVKVALFAQGATLNRKRRGSYT